MEDALRVCQNYKLAYMSSKGKVTQYFKEEAAVVPWDFEPDLLFSRLDQFVARLELVKVRVEMLGVPFIFELLKHFVGEK